MIKIKKKIKIIIPIIALIIIIVIGCRIADFYEKEENQIIPISSQKELEKIYSQKTGETSFINQLLKMPFSLLDDSSRTIDGRNLFK